MSGPRDEPTPAVVLRTQPLRESDLIVVVLTPGRGKLDCLAKGARRSRKRFPGGLPIGARGEAEIGARARGSLIPLTQFIAGADHGKVGRDLELFAYVAYLCELCDRLLDTAVPDPTSFARLCDALATALAGPEPALLRRFELGLLEDLGLLPALERCGVCGSPADQLGEGIAFSLGRGGALCLAHARGLVGPGSRIPPLVLSLAQALLVQEADAAAAAYAHADAVTRRLLRDLCRDMIAPHLRGPLRSLGFFAQIAKPGP